MPKTKFLEPGPEDVHFQEYAHDTYLRSNVEKVSLTPDNVDRFIGIRTIKKLLFEPLYRAKVYLTNEKDA